MFNYSDLFSSNDGEGLYNEVKCFLKKHEMDSLLNSGVLVGFSGGPDSVFLLLFLLEYRRRENAEFKICASHVNHCIRGEEADRDEQFSRNLCDKLGIEFILRKIDVPYIAAETHIGLEEAARNARYSAFSEIISGRNDLSCISIAHNSSDNFETVLFNMLRGTGLKGMCGIKPVRDNIIRPLLCVSKKRILSFLCDNHIDFMIDSSNSSNDYSRNYIRNNIIPKMTDYSFEAENSVCKMCDNLRADSDFIESEVDKIYAVVEDETVYDKKLFAGLHIALFSRLFSRIAYKHNGIYPEFKHIRDIYELLNGDFVSYSLPGECDFIAERDVCYFKSKTESNKSKQIIPLARGKNKIAGTNCEVWIGETPDNSSLNIYKFSIKECVSSDIINKGIYLKFREDGDSYRYGAMTRKLKKIFTQKKIPNYEKDLIPILCDSDGIVWVPGLQVRDGAKGDLTVCFMFSKPKDNETELFTVL